MKNKEKVREVLDGLYIDAFSNGLHDQCGLREDAVADCLTALESLLEQEQDRARWVDPVFIANKMHEWYEDAANKHCWQTQPCCKVPFDELPDENRAVILDVAMKVCCTLLPNALPKTEGGE